MKIVALEVKTLTPNEEQDFWLLMRNSSTCKKNAIKTANTNYFLILLFQSRIGTSLAEEKIFVLDLEMANEYFYLSSREVESN